MRWIRFFSAVSSLQNLPNSFNSWAKQSLIECLMTEVKNCRIQPKKNIFKPLFHQIFKTSKQREHAIQRVPRKYYMLKTYSKPLHLLLTSNFPYILNNDQSKYSKPCWNCANETGRAKSLPVKPTKGLICSVREEPNSVQPCQFRFLTNHYQARAANPRK